MIGNSWEIFYLLYAIILALNNTYMHLKYFDVEDSHGWEYIIKQHSR